MNVQEKVAILKSIDILSFLHETTLERLAEESREIPLKPDQVLFHEGEQGQTMYIILNGGVLIFKKGVDITEMGRGSIFGEMALIEKKPRSASVRTLSQSLLMEINESQFQQYFAGQPQVLMALMKTMSARFRRSLINAPLALSEETAELSDPIKNIDDSGESIFLLDSLTFQMIKGSPPALESCGYSREEILHLKFTDLLVNFETEGLRALVSPLINLTRSMSIAETEIRRKNGTVIPVEYRLRAVMDAQGPPKIMAWLHDISERKHIENTIRQMAYYDSLTGLPNRNLLNDRLAVSLARAKRNQEKICLMFLDLDNFKVINDTLGHEGGDLVLKEVAQRLKKALRQEDTVARMGGDEFVVVAPMIKGSNTATLLAQKILDQFEESMMIQEQELFIGCSIGISTFPDDGEDSKNLLKNADLALYRAKGRGKNNFQMFTPSLNKKALARMTIEKNLHKAVDRGEFELVYQPRVSLSTGKLTGLEGLARWNSPELGRVMPEEFIPVAEETRMIVPLGIWSIRTACQEIRALEKLNLPLVPVAIILSGFQFTHPLFIKELSASLGKFGITHGQLEMEIRETTLMKDFNLSVHTLNQLRELGIPSSIDNFGTGYSTLINLKKLPIDCMKIDQAFLAELGQPTNRALLKTIVEVAENLGLRTIAEGVETEEQREYLEEIGCDEGQGFLFSPPLTSEGVRELLAKNPKF